MPMALWWQFGWIACLGVGAVALTLLLRRGQVPGAAAIASLLVGLTLGPGIAGRLLPDQYEKHLIGAQQARVVYQTAQSAADGAIIAARQLNASIDVDEYARLMSNAQSAHDAWQRAKAQHQRPVHWFTLALATIFALAAARLHRPKREPSVHWPLAIGIGLWSSLLTGGLTALLLSWLGFSASIALLAGAIVGTGPLSLDPRDARSARQAEPSGAALMRMAARCATIIAGTAFTVLLWLQHQSISALAPALVIIAALIGGFAPPISRRTMQRGIRLIVFPWVVALAASRIEVIEHFSIWTILALLVISGDGRWLATTLGVWSLGGRGLLTVMRLVIPSMGAGSMQASLVAVSLAAGVIPESIGFGLLLGVCYMESSVRFRRFAARDLASIEREVDADDSTR